MCTRLGLYSRHNHLRNTLAALLRSFGFSVQLEALPKGQLTRPADVLVCGVSDTPDAADTTFVHILHPTLSLAGLDATKQLQQREVEKRRQNQVVCHQMSWNPVPFAVTTIGQWGPTYKRFMGTVIKLRALQTKEAFADVAHEVWGTITEAVVFAVTRQLDRGFPVSAPSEEIPDDNKNNGPFRISTRLAAEFARVVVPPEQIPHQVEGEGPQDHPTQDRSGPGGCNSRASLVASDVPMALDSSQPAEANAEMERELDVSINLPSGSSLPWRVPAQGPIRSWKAALLRHCGHRPPIRSTRSGWL